MTCPDAGKHTRTPDDRIRIAASWLGIWSAYLKHSRFGR